MINDWKLRVYENEMCVEEYIYEEEDYFLMQVLLESPLILWKNSLKRLEYFKKFDGKVAGIKSDSYDCIEVSIGACSKSFDKKEYLFEWYSVKKERTIKAKMFCDSKITKVLKEKLV